MQSVPIGWFTRSNFGGRFSSLLKYAGWDGIVIEGKADEPVWIDIRDGGVLGDRDINEHCFDSMHMGKPEDMVRIMTEKMPPFQDDQLMFDFSVDGMYSVHMAKLVSWQRYYTRFYKQSLLFCDTRWPAMAMMAVAVSTPP